MKCDLAIIGAGPAGLSAAVAAAEAGARVVVVDENARPGGRLLGQLHEEPGRVWWIGAEVSKTLANRALAASVQILTGREVWGLFPQWKVALDGGDSITAEYVVVATGAAERALPVPGWTIPGVMAIGAAQTLTNYYRVRPGERIAVVGIDPLALTVAHELKMSGADVVGIYLPPKDAFSGPRSNPDTNLRYLAGMADLAPNAFLRIGGRLANVPLLRKIAVALFPRFGLPLMGTRLHLRQSVVRICGDDQVKRVDVALVDRHGNPGRTHSIMVDCVCISGGLYPVQELTQDCDVAQISELGGTIPLHSPEMETSRKNLFVAGNVTGIEGAKIAMAQGTLAGTVIAARLGHLHDPGEAIRRAAEAVVTAREQSAITFMPEINKGRKIAEDLWRQRTGETNNDLEISV